MNADQLDAAIKSALRGEPSSVVIYWDESDPKNPGPAYKAKRGDDGNSGSLDFDGWVNGDGEGANISHFFGPDGLYLGPDQDGMYPDLVS